MTKPVLKLGFVDYFDRLDEFFIDILSQKYEIVRDDNNPDYLIFCDETFGQRNKEFDNRPDVIKIFYTGENRRPWNYSCNYAITFDHYDTHNHYRLPLYVIDYWMMTNRLGMPKIEDVMRSPDDLKSKTGFCGFISGNGVSQARNNMFHSLSSYKKVDSYGPLFNNVGFILPRGLEAAKNKNDILVKYKFNLCFENSSWPGYCTEKLFHAFYMKTIPIYWGSTTSNLDFNPKAYINWHDYQDDRAFFEKIIELDQNDDKYIEMYMQPIFANGDTNRYMDMKKFLSWFDNIYKGVLK